MSRLIYVLNFFYCLFLCLMLQLSIKSLTSDKEHSLGFYIATWSIITWIVLSLAVYAWLAIRYVYNIWKAVLRKPSSATGL